MNDAEQKMYRAVGDLIRQGQAQTAVIRLREWLESNPEDEIGLSMLGSAQMRLKRTDDAMATFQLAVDHHPQSYAAHGDLAFAHMRVGDQIAAIESFEKALSLNANFYQGHCFLAKLKYAAGNIESARASFAESDACDPFKGEFRGIQAAMSAGKFAEAEKIARQVLSRQPGHPKSAYALAHLASNVGAFEEAADILRNSIDLYPCDINLRAALVNSLEETGHYEQALAEAELIAELDPASFAPWLIIGRIHGHCGHYDASLTAYDRALQFTSGNKHESGNIELLRGHVLKILGQDEDGVRAYRKSIELVEDNGAGWWGLADMKTHRFTAADRIAMQEIADNEDAKTEQRTQAAFALGKAAEDDGDRAVSFAWYEKANNLRTGIKFDPSTHTAGTEELIRTFTLELLETGARLGANGPTPIFITGLPRSGSTLIEQILASHSQIEGTMELVNLPNVVRRITIDGGKRKQAYPSSLASFSAQQLAAYGQEYIDSTAVYRSGKPFFIDKLPTNFDKIGLIHMILPNAIIIDARRHPMDCGFSCFKQHFAGGHHFSYDLANIGCYYNNYLRLMDHWDEVLPGKVKCVQYEHMVGNTEETIRSLLEHCGVSFEEACVRFFENKRPVRTASSEQVRQPIYNKSVGYWKNFERQLQPLAHALGQDLSLSL